MHRICIERSRLRLLRYAYSRSRIDQFMTEMPKVSEQLQKVRSLKRSLLSSPNNPHIIEDMKAYIRIPLENRQFSLAEQISLQGTNHLMNPKDLREISFWLYSAVNLGDLSRYEMLILLRTLFNYQYEFDHRDAVFVKNFEKIKTTVDRDIVFFPFLNVRDPSIIPKLFNVREIESICRNFGKYCSIETKNGIMRYKEILRNGWIHNLWSQDFKKEMYGLGQFMLKNKQDPYTKSLCKAVKFAVCSSRDDCTIEPRKESSIISNSEIKISRFLKELGYIFLPGPQINGKEVDFLIGDRIVLEYNGYAHYCINSPKNLTNYNKYSYRRLEQMGFIVNLIDSIKWEEMEYKEKQMKFLIDKIEMKIANIFE